MSLFRKDEDPLDKELRKLEEMERTLARKARLLERDLQPSGSAATAPKRPRGATFVDDQETRTSSGFKRQARRLRVQQQQARNRFLLILGLIGLLTLLICKVVL
jgi:hypothetical protein